VRLVFSRNAAVVAEDAKPTPIKAAAHGA